jgi:hypothetical protein
MDSFVYRWKDDPYQKFYIGVHKGCQYDGYLCSSKLVREEYRKRPGDFIREIIATGTYEDMYLLETQLLKEVDARNNPSYYNQHNNESPFYHQGPKSREHLQKISLANKNSQKVRDQIKRITTDPIIKSKLALTRKTSSKFQSHVRRLNSDPAIHKKSARSQSGTWVITFPDGQQETIVNLREFCRTNNLNQSSMWRVSRGQSSKHKGFACLKVQHKKTIS